MNNLIRIKSLISIFIFLIIAIFLFYSCSTTNWTRVKVDYILEGHSENISNDTLFYLGYFNLGELHFEINLYDYIAVEDSIHLFFESLFASKCTNFIQLYTFENLDNNKLKLFEKFIWPSFTGRFKLVIPLQDTTIKIAIKSEEYGYAFASYEVKID